VKAYKIVRCDRSCFFSPSLGAVSHVIGRAFQLGMPAYFKAADGPPSSLEREEKWPCVSPKWVIHLCSY
jgi:hypothetical protein